MTDAPAYRYLPSLEEKLDQLEGAQKAIDLIALDLMDGQRATEVSGKALMYIADHLEADIAAIRAAIVRHENTAADARPANLWAIECPWSNGQEV